MPDKDYLCFYFNHVRGNDRKFGVTGGDYTIDLKYSIDNCATGIQYEKNAEISVITGTTLFGKGTNTSFSQSLSPVKFTMGNYFYSEESITVSGNIMSLIDETCESTTIPCDNCFSNLFHLPMLTSALNLNLPATTLTVRCYSSLFSNSLNLKYPPRNLPAMILTRECYFSMFNGCRSLLYTPKLPSRTLSSQCYSQMFASCTSLERVPELPNVELTSSCYSSMFNGCTSLQISDTQTAEAPYAGRIPTTGYFINTTEYNQSDMFKNCLGTRSSDTMPGVRGECKTYYTQNPIGQDIPLDVINKVNTGLDNNVTAEKINSIYNAACPTLSADTTVLTQDIKIKSISRFSTNDKYPSAKAVYDYIQSLYD